MMFRHQFVALVVAALCSVLMSGCGENTPSKETSAPAVTVTEQPAVVTPADDATAVAALEAAGAKMKKDGNGNVSELDFTGTTAGDSELEHLTGLQALRSLKLNETGVTDAGMIHVGKVTTLNNLDMRGCSIGNAGLEPLADLIALRALRLSGKSGSTTVDDGGMAHVGKLTALKALLLDYLWVGDQGLAELKNLKNL